MRLDAQRDDLVAKYNAKLQEKDNQLMITRHEEQAAKLSQKRLTQKLADAVEQLRMEKAYKREVELGAKIACERLYFAIKRITATSRSMRLMLHQIGPRHAGQ